jgi:hypothetical protein
MVSQNNQEFIVIKKDDMSLRENVSIMHGQDLGDVSRQFIHSQCAF